MQKKEKMLMVIMALCLLSILPFMSAATLNRPVATENVSTTLTINMTVDSNGARMNMSNVTCYYNVTGGVATTFLKEILNASKPDLDFTDTVDVSALSDATTYNLSCNVYNGSTFNVTKSALITIDNADSVISLSASPTSLDLTGLLKLTWASSDATSGLNSTIVTLTSPNTGLCPTQTWTTSSGTDTTVDSTVLTCPGTYTASFTAIDYAGNSVTSTQDITLNVGASSGGSSAASSDSSTSVEGGYITGPNGKASTDSRNIVIVVIAILAIYLLAKHGKK